MGAGVARLADGLPPELRSRQPPRHPRSYSAAGGGLRGNSSRSSKHSFLVAAWWSGLPIVCSTCAGLAYEGPLVRRAGRRSRPAPTSRRRSRGSSVLNRPRQTTTGGEAQQNAKQGQVVVETRRTSAVKRQEGLDDFEEIAAEIGVRQNKSNDSQDGFLDTAKFNQELESVWHHPGILSFLRRSPTMASDREEMNRQMLDLMSRIITNYSHLVASLQLQMIPDTLAANGLAASDLYTSQADVRELEEPMSFRPLANDLGLRAFGLDLYLWRQVHRREDSKGQGFGGGAMRELSTADGLQALPCGHFPEVKYHWHMVFSVAESIATFLTNMEGRVRIVLPRRLNERLEERALTLGQRAKFDLCSYSGAPTPDMLMSEVHCGVLLVLEEPVLGSDANAWSLPVRGGYDEGLGQLTQQDLLADLDADELAPVLVLGLMAHSVELKIPVCVKKAKPIVEELMESGISPHDPEPFVPKFLQDVFHPLNQEDMELVKDAAVELSVKVGPYIRQAYASSFARLKQKRLADLSRSKTIWREQDTERRQREAKCKAARQALLEAADCLDTTRFSRLAKETKKGNLMPEDEITLLENAMYADLDVAEAPFRKLVALHTQGGRSSSPHYLGTEELEKELASSKLPAKSRWRQAGKDLCASMNSLAELSQQVEKLKLNNHSSAASLKVAVLHSTAMLKTGEAALVRFEGSAKAAGVKLGKAGAVPLRSVLDNCAIAIKAGKADEELWACLSSLPWSTRLLEAGNVTQQDVAELEERCSDASGAALSRFEDTVQTALKLGRCALGLQKASKSGDQGALESALNEAKEMGLQGLDVFDDRLQELRLVAVRLQEVRGSVREVLETLDLQEFEELLSTAKASGLRLPEEVNLRLQLMDAIAEAETVLREPLLAAIQDVTGEPSVLEDLQKALEASRLPPTSQCRRAAEAGKRALEVVASLRSASAAVAAAARAGQEDSAGVLPGAVEALEQALEQASQALECLREEAKSMGDDRLMEPPALLQALEEGQVILRGLQGDHALQARLDQAPWNLKPLPLEEASAGDLDELRRLADEATIDGLKRATAQLDAALAAGHCARALQKALDESDQMSLSKWLLEAENLKLSGLEDAWMHYEDLLQEEREAEAARERRQATEARARRRVSSSAAARSRDADARYRDGLEENSNLIFLDLELTSGFYEFDERPRVLEAAMVVTDKNLKEQGRGSWVIGDFTREDLEALGDFHQAHFRDANLDGPFPPRLDLPGGGNGLFADVLKSSLSKEDVEGAMLDLVRKHCPPGACPLSGYSVQCDREVLRVEMPRLYRYVSHQIVDVTSFLRMARVCDPERFKQWDRRPSRYNHRALNDVQDSIETLRWVQEEFFLQRS